MTSELALGTVTLAYRQSGGGPDIVWLAAGDNPGDNWRLYQTPAFDDAYRSTTYDARGVGRTSSRTPPPWTIAEDAGDLAELIEAVCAGPVFLIGLSMGSLIAFRREGGSLPPAFATAHYAMQYFPADALGDDETWERLKPIVAAGFAQRDGAMLAAQWQACLDFDSGPLLAQITAPIHAVAFCEDLQTPPARVHEVAELARSGHFHVLQGLGHGSAFGHRPDVVNACLRSIVDGYA